MADLTVQPSYQLKETDILSVDKINLMATPVVSLAIETPVTDINFFRNGNFYSSFWSNPAGGNCPIGVETQNASYWLVNPNGAAVTSKRSTDVPDVYSLWTLELDGAANVTDCSVGQQINGDLSATMRRPCTFSGQIENNSGSNISPTLEIWTANAFNNFAAVTLQHTVNLQTIANAAWGYVTATIDLSTLVNVANGLFVKIRLPTGALSSTSKRVNFSRIKIQLGELATQFTDDPAQFIQTTTVDATMLQDGCLARPTLYVTNPGVIPQGAFAPGAIQSGDIGPGQVKAANLDLGISTTTSANFTVPLVGANVPITLTTVTGISAGLILNIQGAGAYSTVSVAGNVVTAQNTGASGNAPFGTVINSGATVTSADAVVGCLGYTPINKAGDNGVGKLQFVQDTVVHGTSYVEAGTYVQLTTPNASNDGFFPAIGFNRPGSFGRAIGLETTGRFKTVDHTNKVGYLLDTVTGVDTASYQPGSITLAALAQSLINIVIPAGMVRMFAGPSPPVGWLICDGSAVSRTTYAGLFAQLGTYWGAGDNITTFNLPDFRGRSPLGYVNSAIAGITARTFGSLGGEEDHALITGELASHAHGVIDYGHIHGLSSDSHSHTITDPTHRHGGNVGVLTGNANIGQGSNNISANYGYTDFASTGINHTNAGPSGVTIAVAATGIQIQNAGSNAGHNNMQPFAVLYFIIKT